MNSSARILLPLLGAFPVLSACTTLLDGRYDYREGWRRGRVLAVVAGAAVERPGYWTCLRQVPAAERANRYALIAYPVTGRASRRHLVPLLADVDLKPGESVLVNLARCDGAVVQRPVAPTAPTHPPKGEGRIPPHDHLATTAQ